MTTAYVTPQYVSDKLGDELLQILNLPSTADVVTPATEYFTTGTITSPSDTATEVAARRLAIACKTSNGVVEGALRSQYQMPLALDDGETVQDRYPNIAAAAAAIAKWEILKERKDIRSSTKDREEYTDALAYLGIEENGKPGGESLASGLDITSVDAGTAPRGATTAIIGDPEVTRQRRNTMSNQSWVDEY